MSNLLSQLTESEQARLLEDLNYMNLAEIRSFCSQRGIPFDLRHKRAGGGWKALRTAKAKSALATLARIARF